MKRVVDLPLTMDNKDSQDLVGCLQNKYEGRNWGFDVIRSSILYAMNQSSSNDVSYIYNSFRRIGTCESMRLVTAGGIELLSKYYLLRYKPNSTGIASVYADGSVNYSFGEYANELLKRSKAVYDDVANMIESIKQGLKDNIDVVVAFDTSINKGLIVDGTKRSLALYYLKHNEEKIFRDLLASSYTINIVFLKSTVCRILFPIDFCRLC